MTKPKPNPGVPLPLRPKKVASLALAALLALFAANAGHAADNHLGS